MGVAAIPVAIGAAQIGIALQSQITSSQANEQIQKNNALMARWSSEDAMNRGSQQASLLRQHGEQVASTQRAIMAANGVETTTGSPGRLSAATYGLNEQDVAMAMSNAARQAWGFSAESAQFSAGAALARTQGYLGMAGTVIGGLGTALDMYNRYYRPTVGTGTPTQSDIMGGGQ